ncbi:Trimethylguanosine synthase [Sparganum proliferum]
MACCADSSVTEVSSATSRGVKHVELTYTHRRPAVLNRQSRNPSICNAVQCLLDQLVKRSIQHVERFLIFYIRPSRISHNVANWWQWWDYGHCAGPACQIGGNRSSWSGTSGGDGLNEVVIEDFMEWVLTPRIYARKRVAFEPPRQPRVCASFQYILLRNVLFPDKLRVQISTPNAKREPFENLGLVPGGTLVWEDSLPAHVSIGRLCRQLSPTPEGFQRQGSLDRSVQQLHKAKMQNIPIDTLSDVSDSDSEAEQRCSSPPTSAFPQSSEASVSGTATSAAQSFLRSNRRRRKIKRYLLVTLNSERFKGDASLCSDPEMTKWWKRRYDLFERFDDGIELDKESWYSVTPEIIARHQARKCSCGLVIDGFAGVGGNSIQFSQTCAFVISIDNCVERLGLLRRNAAVYGVTSKIDPICGDLASVLSAFRSGPIASRPPSTIEPAEKPSCSSEQVSCHPSLKESNPLHADMEESSVSLTATLAGSDLSAVHEATPGPADTNSLSVPSPPTCKESLEPLLADTANAAPAESDEMPNCGKEPRSAPETILPPTDDNSTVATVTSDSETSASKEPQMSGSIVDVVFMSPPWGGQNYKERVLPPGASSWNRKRRKLWFETLGDEPEPFFNLDDIEVLPGAMAAARRLTNRVVVYLPRNTAIGQLLKLGWRDMTDCRDRVDVVIEDYWLRGRRLAVAAYVGDFNDFGTTED